MYNKRDKYRRLLDAVFKEIRKNSDWNRCFEDGHLDLVLFNPLKIRDLHKRFEKIKRER